MTRVGLVFLAAGAVACTDTGVERMMTQHRGAPFKSSRWFADGKVMRSPPTGTVDVIAIVGESARTRGVENGRWVDRYPVPISRPFIEEGRRSYDAICAACHGFAGDGVSEVARRMTLRRPPSLGEAELRHAPVGRIYQVVTDGYGLMPSYRTMLDTNERWAVVAYVEALQRSQSIALPELPPAMRREAEEALK